MMASHQPICLILVSTRPHHDCAPSNTTSALLTTVQGPGYYYDTSLVFDKLDTEAIDTLLRVTTTPPAGCIDAVTLLMPLGGALTRVPLESTAFGHRMAGFWCISLAKWAKPEARPACVDFMKQLKAAMKPWLAGTYNTLAAFEELGR